MKSKNPLYVVKGKDVLEASTFVDYFIKKLNLAPLILFIQKMLKIILENINSYTTLVSMKNFFNELISQLLDQLKHVKTKFS